MTKIKTIEKYFPEQSRDVSGAAQRFAVSQDFLDNKIGISRVRISDYDEDASEMCYKAFQALSGNTSPTVEPELILVCTQTPDFRIPHVSALVHNKIGAGKHCACFDVSLGCSGYVYALSVAKSFMQENNISTGLIFTCDPYSKIVDENDKNTSLLFGDAATVTIISPDGNFEICGTDFITISSDYDALLCKHGGLLSMDGRRIFNFVMRYVPDSVRSCLQKNKKKVDDVDLFLFHQASKYVVDNLRCRMNLPEQKVPFDIKNYGNTVSSSIPILLHSYIQNNNYENIIISGFGVGLSLATTLLRRV